MKTIKVHEITNLRQIKATFMPPTNTRGARVKIWEPKRYNDDKIKPVILSFDYAIGDIQQQALNYLLEKGFNVVARASDIDSYILLCDNWGEEFIEL